MNPAHHLPTENQSAMIPDEWLLAEAGGVPELLSLIPAREEAIRHAVEGREDYEHLKSLVERIHEVKMAHGFDSTHPHVDYTVTGQGANTRITRK